MSDKIITNLENSIKKIDIINRSLNNKLMKAKSSSHHYIYNNKKYPLLLLSTLISLKNN